MHYNNNNFKLNSTPHFEKWLTSLNQETFRAISKLLMVLQNLGHEVRMPQSRPLGNRLFELREMHFGLRVYYAFQKQGHIVLLKGGNKSSQDRDIKIAYQLLTDLGE